MYPDPSTAIGMLKKQANIKNLQETIMKVPLQKLNPHVPSNRHTKVAQRRIKKQT